MGMFNHIRCRYPLPDPEARDFAFQTKALPEQLLDDYEITEDGRLLHEAYDARWEEDPAAPLGFYLHRENLCREAVDFTGELEIHTSSWQPDGSGSWYSYLFELVQGRVVGLQHGPGHGVPLPTRVV